MVTRNIQHLILIIFCKCKRQTESNSIIKLQAIQGKVEFTLLIDSIAYLTMKELNFMDCSKKNQSWIKKEKYYFQIT